MLRRFYSEAGFVLAASVVSRAKDLVATPLLTFYAGSALYGAWTQANLVVAFATPLIGLGLQQGFVRYASGLPEPEQARRFTGLFVVSVALGGALLLAIVASTEAVEALLFAGETGFTSVLLAVSTMLLVTPMRGAYESWYLMRGRARSLVAVRVGNSLCSVAVLGGLVWVDAGFDVIVRGMVAVEATFLVFFMLLMIGDT